MLSDVNVHTTCERHSTLILVYSMSACVVSFAVSMVNAATIDEDEASLVRALQLPYLRLTSVTNSNASAYLRHLSDARLRKMVSSYRKIP